MDAFGNSCHFGVVVPVEFQICGDQDEEKGEFCLDFDGESEYLCGFFEEIDHVIQLRDFQFIYLADQEFEVHRFVETTIIKMFIFIGDGFDEIDHVFQASVLEEY